MQISRKGPGPGTTIGGFRIERLLGIGGMGEVYLAKQLSMDRDVALKILPERMLTQKDLVERFLNEAKLLARLEHPHIVTAHEAGQDGGVLFMAMAFVKGEPLDRKMSRDGPMPEREALILIRKIASALAYAWNEHQLLHRDIKPANILLDTNGEPKLADLGLSRRITEDSGMSVHEQIIGTPNYMSPEQAEGNRKIDFRSDMYSLGATLYHVLTGQLPFAAESVLETLRKQVTETLDDPRNYVPDISEGCVVLLERMLAKDPMHRHSSWEALLVDVDRVLHARAPQADGMKNAPSMLSRKAGARPVRVVVPAKGRPVESAHPVAVKHSAARTAAILFVLAVVAASSVYLYRVVHTPPPGVVPSIAPEPPLPVSPVPDPAVAQAAAEAARQKDLERRFEESLKFAQEHPAEGKVASEWLAGLRVEAAGTPLEIKFTARITAWENDRRRAVAEEERVLRSWAENAGTEDALGQAMARVTDYHGPYESETAGLRAELLASLRSALEEKVSAREREQAGVAWETLRGTVAEQVLRMDFAAAQESLVRFRETPEGRAISDGRMDRLQTILEKISKIRDVVLESFRQDIGRPVSIMMQNGAETWEIRSVGPDSLELAKSVGSGQVARTLRFDELSLAEQFRRLGTDATPDREIMRGLISCLAGRVPNALQSFDSSDDILGPALSAVLRQSASRSLESAAEKSFSELLQQAGVTRDSTNETDWVRTLRRRKYSEAEVSVLRQSVTRFKNQYGNSTVATVRKNLFPVLDAIGTQPLEVDPRQMDEVMAKLAAANPQRRPLNTVFANADRGPELSLAENPGLVQVDPLAGLPLAVLDLSRTRVRDLTPLAGMPLRELNVSDTPTQSLDPLKGMTLERLEAENCPITDLTPLTDAPLKTLSLGGTRVSAILPLMGKPLRKLSLRDTKVQTLRALRGAPLEELSLQGCLDVDSLESLRGAPLRKLSLAGTSLRDLTALSDMPLEELTADHMRFLHELTGLEKAPLKNLVLLNTPVSDLRPIAQCPIVELDLRSTEVEDLSPLEGSSVEMLYLEGSDKIRDLGPLLNCERLAVLMLPNRQINPTILKAHPGLMRIGYTPDTMMDAQRFWAEFEAGRAGAHP